MHYFSHIYSYSMICVARFVYTYIFFRFVWLFCFFFFGYFWQLALSFSLSLDFDCCSPFRYVFRFSNVPWALFTQQRGEKRRRGREIAAADLTVYFPFNSRVFFRFFFGFFSLVQINIAVKKQLGLRGGGGGRAYRTEILSLLP